METKNNNINFFKKIYFSICKTKKYGELSKIKFRKCAYYVMDLMLICSIIYSSIITFQISKNANGLQEYLEQNFPELVYEEGTLISEKQERIILNHELVKANFGGQIVIDTDSEYEELINEYSNTGEASILLTANKYVTINSQGAIAEYDYNEIISEDTEGEQTTIGKEYFINIFSNISYSYYFFLYLLGACIGMAIIVFAYNLFISGIGFIICKIKKLKVKFSEIYKMGLYAHTLSILVYFIMNFVPTNVAQYMQVIVLSAPIAYLSYAIYINKWKMPESK